MLLLLLLLICNFCAHIKETDEQKQSEIPIPES